MSRVTQILFTTITLLLVLAPAALADAINGGEGLYGNADDRVVTYAGFVLIITFPLIALLLTLLQRTLEKRKEGKVAAAKARAGRSEWHGGW